MSPRRWCPPGGAIPGETACPSARRGSVPLRGRFPGPLARPPQPSPQPPMPVPSNRSRRRHYRWFARRFAILTAATRSASATGNSRNSRSRRFSRHALHQHCSGLPPQYHHPNDEQSRNPADQYPLQAIEPIRQRLNRHAGIAAIHLILALRRHSPPHPVPRPGRLPAPGWPKAEVRFPTRKHRKVDPAGTASRV